MNMRDIQSAFGKMRRKLEARIKGIVRRGVISNSDSSGAQQTLQTKLLADDVADGVEHMEPYGFTSRPPVGSEGLVFAVGGERAHAVGLNFGNRSDRLADLDEGEVAVYHPSGSSIIMRNDGSIEAVAAPGQTVNLGGVPPAALAVARETDPVTALPNLQAWITAVDTAIGVMAGAFNVDPPAPMSSLGTGAVVPSAGVTPVGDIANISAGGAGSTST